MRLTGKINFKSEIVFFGKQLEFCMEKCLSNIMESRTMSQHLFEVILPTCGYLRI